jgi:hypothetical protein
MKKKKKILTRHANWRFEDRTDQSVSRKKIINYLQNGGEIIYAKRLTITRSLAYLPIDNEIFKVIINRKSRIIVSILPWQDVFKATFIFFSKYYDEKDYIVELYPDCFLETKSKHALTKIYMGKDKKPIGYNHPFFEGLFEAAWNMHLAGRKINGKKTEAKEQTTTFEFEKKEDNKIESKEPTCCNL